MINYVIYSNTSYLDILKIQIEYIKNKDNCILLIDENNLNLENIYQNFNKVIHYSNSYPYATRIMNCIKKIDFEYFILIHDIDILLYSNEIFLKDLFKFIQFKKYDRIDLRLPDTLISDKIYKIEDHVDPNNWNLINHNEIDDNYFLVKNQNPYNYIYNVNPSIWKKDTLLEIMYNFKHKCYRTIEDFEVQKFCIKYNIFRIYNNKKLDCGYFTCINDFKFLHITHGGKLLPLNDSFVSIYGQSYKDCSEDYLNIINKFELRSSDRWII